MRLPCWFDQRYRVGQGVLAIKPPCPTEAREEDEGGEERERER